MLPIHLLEGVEQLLPLLCVDVLFALGFDMVHYGFHRLLVLLDAAFGQQILKFHVLLDRRQMLVLPVGPFVSAHLAFTGFAVQAFRPHE